MEEHHHNTTLSAPPSPSHEHSVSSTVFSCSTTEANNYNFTINYHYTQSSLNGADINNLTQNGASHNSPHHHSQHSGHNAHNSHRSPSPRLNGSNPNLASKTFKKQKKNNSNNTLQHSPQHSSQNSNDHSLNHQYEHKNNENNNSPSSPLEHSDTNLNVTIDRFGFPMDENMDEKEHRKQVKKENARLLKWQDMVFSKKSGGASAEADNEIDQQIHHWNVVKNHRKLKSRIRKGVPQQLRGTIWQNLSGARERRKIECARYGSKNLYNDLRGRKKSPYHDQIWKDINRTYRKNLAFGASQLANATANVNNDKKKNDPNGNTQKSGTQKFFKNVLQDTSVILTPQDLEKNATPAQMALYNVLKGFSLYRKDIGYCQGMQAVTALLLMYMTEEEAFWVLASLADDTKYQMDNLWRPNMPAIQLRFYQMERLVKITCPKLSSHFEKHGISSASMYQASQWFITIFLATDMKFGTIVRVWDIYLNEGLKTVFRMGVGFLKYFEKQLLQSDFEQMLELFRMGAALLDPEQYIKICFATRITHAQLAAFEKDFNRQQQKMKH